MRQPKVTMAQVSQVMGSMLAANKERISIGKASEEIASQLGISKNSAYSKVCALREQFPAFAQGFGTDDSGFRVGKEKILQCLDGLKLAGKQYPTKGELYHALAAELGISPVFASIRISQIISLDGECKRFIDPLINKDSLGISDDKIEKRLLELMQANKLFRSQSELFENIAAHFKKEYDVSAYNKFRVRVGNNSRLETIANALVVPIRSRTVAPSDFQFKNKQDYPPAYMLGLLDNGSLWFHFHKGYLVPRPMFTITNHDRRPLDLIAEYFEAGEVMPIMPNEFRFRLSGFEQCRNLRIFLEKNQPINLARQCEKWLGLWDTIVSQRGKGGPEINADVGGITTMPHADKVVLPNGKLPLEWIVGFIDGSLGRFFDARFNDGYLVARAQMHSVSEPLMNAIKDTLGVGKVSKLKDKDKYKYFVSRPDTGLLANALEQFPPIINHERFILWKEVASFARENNKPEGTRLKRMEALVERLNSDEGVVRRGKD